MQNQSSKQAKAIPGIEKQKPPSKSKQASKQERKKQKYAKHRQRGTSSHSKSYQPKHPERTNPSIHIHQEHFSKKKNPNQLSLSQLNRILLLPEPDPNLHSTPSLYKTGVEGACLMPGGTGNCALRVATTSIAERVFADNLVADNLVADNLDDVVVVAVRGSGSGGRGRRMWRATESIVKPRDAIT
jgi:hypothetical protein